MTTLLADKIDADIAHISSNLDSVLSETGGDGPCLTAGL